MVTQHERNHRPAMWCPKGWSRSDYVRWLRYGLTPEGWKWMLEQQGGACAFCDRDATCVDHDHSDDAVRVLLCRACNTAVGQIEDGLRGQRIQDFVRAHALA